MSSLSMSSSSAPAYSPDHISSSEQLCYVHCSFCDTVLAVSVPESSLFKTVTVRCGHCSNLLSVTVSITTLLLPSASNLPHSLPPPPNLLDHEEEMRVGGENMNMNMNMMMNQHGVAHHHPDKSLSRHGRMDHLQDMPRPPPPPNRPPEKRQRVPSAYNRFIKEEIQRIKASNPDITHREAFSAAAKNWAHFPHIHFGLMPHHPPPPPPIKKPNNVRQQELGEDVMLPRQPFYASAPPNLALSHN